MISERGLRHLEFHRLLDVVAGSAYSDAAKQKVCALRPLSDRTRIEERQQEVREMQRLQDESRPFPFSPYQDITAGLRRALPEGAILEAVELASFIPILTLGRDFSQHLDGDDAFPGLQHHLACLSGQPDLLKALTRAVDSAGAILDTASPDLAVIRREIRRTELAIQRRLEDLMRDPAVSVFLQDTFITRRAGRWVIPVRMDSKGQVQGVVHDVSKSGETAFIEPLSVIHLSNEHENLVADEKAEEIRILRRLTAAVRERAAAIRAEFGTIVHLDLLNCIVLFGRRMEMKLPGITEKPALRIDAGRHPLLVISFEQAGGRGEVVPLDLAIGREHAVMVITGSNAGGKTVAIKTVGMLLAMALAGMPVPAAESSLFPVIASLLVDIGDEQSIEQNLSTFSAHISNIASILEKADSRTLVLIDELGTGTDPDEGAALACAVLSRLKDKGALVCATTHLTGIKGFVHRTPGMANAAMEFDRQTLRPLYRLRTGEPGQSHALEIALQYGLPEEVVSTARDMLGSGRAEFESLIEDLRRKRTNLEEGLRELDRQQQEMAARETSLLSAEKLSEEKRIRLLDDAYAGASVIMADAKRKLGTALDEIRKEEKAGLRQQIRELEAAQRILAEQKARIAGPARELDMEKVSIGAQVFVRSLGCDAVVIDRLTKAGRLRVRAGNIEMEIPLSEAELSRGTVSISSDETQPAHVDETVPLTLHLVGQRVDDAIARLEPFLNHAALAGLREVTVIHGIGKGVLARAVRDHLKGHPLVRSYRRGARHEGGEGVTVIALNQ